ncbi:MAG: ShlB/FhaC/HecB family hemolysin secretion/activation protein [Oceanospirillales bacterium]|nr:MAG: ShlB/FhaC/HecB family hemolysin secretion/activation protein [Oceanospirillales bacterium]
MKHIQVFQHCMSLKPTEKSSILSFTFSLCIGVLGISSVASAQTLPDAGSLLRQQEQLQQRFPQQLPEPDKSEADKPVIQDLPGVTVHIKAFRFSGLDGMITEPELQLLLKDSVGQELDFAGLLYLADRVTEHLRNLGWILARAYLPRQDVTEGVIEIAILKGRLEGSVTEGGGWTISLSDESRINSDKLAAIAEAAAPSGSSARQQELERALLLINDIPGISAGSRLEPGSEAGTTRVLVDAIDEPLLTGNLWTDNHGNTSTGEVLVNAVLNLNNPAGFGDQASLGLSASEGIRLARLNYSAPLGHQGLRASAGYTDLHYKVKKGNGVNVGLEGQSSIVNLGLSYPFVRSRAVNLLGSLDYQYKALKDDSIAGTLRNKRIDRLSIGLSGNRLDQWGNGGLNSFDLSVTAGDLDLSRVPTDLENDAATLSTQGSYSKLNLEASRLQRLSGNFTLLARVSAQLSDGNLDSSEQFILGGPTGVRAYPIGEAQGDEGWLASAELNYDWPGGTPLGALQLKAFADTGGILVHKNSSRVSIANDTGNNRYQLSGAGLSVSLNKPSSYSVRLTWAHTLGNNPGRFNGKNADGKSDNNRFWLQAISWF